MGKGKECLFPNPFRLGFIAAWWHFCHRPAALQGPARSSIFPAFRTFRTFRSDTPACFATCVRTRSFGAFASFNGVTAVVAPFVFDLALPLALPASLRCSTIARRTKSFSNRAASRAYLIERI